VSYITALGAQIIYYGSNKPATHNVTEALTRECLRSGSRGRPFIPQNPDQVEFLISVGRSMEEIAQTLLISRRTLYRRCEESKYVKSGKGTVNCQTVIWTT